MSSRRFFRSPRAKTPRSLARSARRLQPGIETLEDRVVLSPSNGSALALASTYGDSPMVFEANQGQTDPQVRFLSRGNGYALYLTPGDAVLSLTRRRPVQPSANTLASNFTPS